METRKRLAALLAAGALAFGIAGVALAEDLNPGQVGQTLGGFAGSEEECAEFALDIGAGEVGLHFILTDPEASSGNLDATFSNPASSFTGLANTPHPSTTLHWNAVITGDADTVLESASTDVDGGNLVLSHACFGEPPVTEPPVTEPPVTEPPSAPPSFEQSEAPVTEPPVTEPPVTEPPVTEPPVTEPPVTEPPVTEPPVTEPPVTEPPVTEPPSPSFFQSEAAETDAPSEPDTATIGGSDEVGSPAGSAWLLVVALGLLLASIVVLTPVRAKNPR